MKSFQYLGETYNEVLGEGEEMKERILAGSRTYFAENQILKSRLNPIQTSCDWQQWDMDD